MAARAVVSYVGADLHVTVSSDWLHTRSRLRYAAHLGEAINKTMGNNEDCL